MSILNITNMTKDPKSYITDNFICARKELEKEGITIDVYDFDTFVENCIDDLENLMDNSLGKDLINIIDNYLINHDYYGELEQFINNN